MTTDVLSPRRGRGRIFLQVLAAVCVLLVASAAFYVRSMTRSRATPPPPLPVPNGYDDFIRAAGLLKGLVPNQGNIQSAKLEDLKTWVASNAEALKVVREGLTKPSRVPVVYSQDIKLELDHVQGCRSLGRLLACEAEIARREDRPGDAVGASLDGFLLAHATARGGLLIDVLTGIALERVALDGLTRVRDRLSQDEARKAIAVLLEADRARETFAEVRNTEDYWFEQTAPLSVRLPMRITGVGEKMREPADAAAKRAIQTAQKTLRREAVDLAEHLYFLERKAEPSSLGDLVPAYLPELPVDPFTDRPLDEPE
jgi:hypothetical protein